MDERKVKPHGLNKAYMLKSQITISSLYKSGESIYKFPFTAKLKTKDTQSNPPLQIVFAVPKRKIPKAHDRNLIKRRIKESFRQNKTALESLLEHQQQSLEMLLIYSTHQSLTYQEIDSKLKKFLKVIHSTINNGKV